MGVDTRLYISNRFSVEDVGQIINSYLDGEEVKIMPSHTTEMSIITFKIGDDHRTMYVHRSNLPTGPALMLSLGRNEQAIQIMRTIGNAIGGILEESDCDGKMESIGGRLSDEDGLQYFLKWAVINNKIPNQSMKELNEAIKEWHKQVTPREPIKYDLY